MPIFGLTEGTARDIAAFLYRAGFLIANGGFANFSSALDQIAPGD